jgi:lipopolysaccharide biosynthesis glycosyltransferase
MQQVVRVAMSTLSVRFLAVVWGLVSPSSQQADGRVSGTSSRFGSVGGFDQSGGFLAPVGSQANAKQASSSEHAPSGAMRHVVFAADSTVFGALLRSMQSLTLHLDAPERYNIHVIAPAADMQQASSLVDCFRKRLGDDGKRVLPRVQLHKVIPTGFQPDYRDRPDLRGHVTASARFMIPEYLPNAERAVYIDTDTLVLGDLAPLFEMHLNHPLAAVEEGTSWQETWGKWYPDLAKRVENPGDKTIFNDGVLVLDLPRWRAENITGNLANWALNAGASVDDQLLLNLEFQTRTGFDVLEHQWNDYRVRSTGWPEYGWSDELAPEDELSHARITHWTGPKPWNLKPMQQAWLEQYRHLWEPRGGKAEVSCALDVVSI